jgi:hypothetical protein
LARVTTLAFAKVTMLIAANAPVLARFVWHVGRVDRRTRLAKGAAAAPDVATRRAPHTISQREAAVRVYACAPRLLAVGAVGRVCAPRLAECDTRVRIVVRRAQTERASERAVGASGTSEWSGKEQHESERGHFMLPHAQAEPAGVSGATGCHAEAREPKGATGCHRRQLPSLPSLSGPLFLKLDKRAETTIRYHSRFPQRSITTRLQVAHSRHAPRLDSEAHRVTIQCYPHRAFLRTRGFARSPDVKRYARSCRLPPSTPAFGALASHVTPGRPALRAGWHRL